MAKWVWLNVTVTSFGILYLISCVKVKKKKDSDLNLKYDRRACSIGFLFLLSWDVFTDLCFKSSIIRVNCWQQACLFQKPCWHCCGLETDQRVFPKNSGQLILWTVWTVFFVVLHLLCSAYKLSILAHYIRANTVSWFKLMPGLIWEKTCVKTYHHITCREQSSLGDSSVGQCDN